jgi:3-hydroxyisobutyrate dehydrogenase
MVKQVTLIGLGSMGMGIAQSILKAGFDLTVYNRTAAKTDSLSRSGASVAASPREAAETADIVICMVADDFASRHVWLGDAGALSSARPDTIFIECSTLSYVWIRELAHLAKHQGLSFLDAPVNGGPKKAATGELKIMVGGEADVLDRARPVLEAFTSQIYYMGPTGTGTLMKLAHNMMSAVQMVALAESMNLAEHAGLNLEQVVAILTGSGPASPLVKRNAPLMASHNYGEPSFLLRHIRKDVSYALRLGEEFDVPLMTANAAREVYRIAGRLGYDDAEFAAVFEALRH